MQERFSVPIAIIIFKRKDTVLKIIDRIRQVNPRKLYIISDYGRNEEECRLVEECRKAVENAIDWDCELIKDYAKENRGVHAQIGLGALRVFQQEQEAIFLEDDNLPEVSFFDYCKKCLDKYRNDENIFWICGTNYLEQCKPKNGASVFASKHLMPCGWASWKSKFEKYYDYDLKLTDRQGWEKILKRKYRDKRLYRQQLRSIRFEVNKKHNGLRYNSWDYHTVLSIRMNNLYGIVPCNNQIENIGVDAFSTHGGSSFNDEMTRRFCGIKSYPMPSKLVLPEASNLDLSFEKSIGKIILFPLKNRIILDLRDLLHVPDDVRLREVIFGKKHGTKNKYK